MVIVAGKAKASGTDLGNPVVQIIVVCYSANFSILQVEEGTGGQDVFLAFGLRQALISLEIFAVHGEFGRRRVCRLRSP